MSFHHWKKSKSSPRSLHSGFTLIELLVVISIISLLIALLMPALKAARDQTRQTLCLSNMRQYGLTAALYDMDFRELPMTQGESNVHNEFNLSAIMSLKNHYRMPDNFRQCPSAPRWQRTFDSFPVMMFDLIGGRHSYYAGTNIHGWRTNITSPWADRWPQKVRGWYPQLSMSKPDRKSVMPHYYGDIILGSTLNVTLPPVSNHHTPDGKAKGGNLLFLDGHAEWQRLEAGKSWRVGRSAYNTHYMNSPNYPPPPGSNTFFYNP